MGLTPRWLDRRSARTAKAGTKLRLALASPLLLASWLSSATASADPVKPGTSLIVLVADEPGDAVSARLEQDLRSMGLGVVVLAATPENGSGAAALERTARGLGGVGAIHVLSGGRGSELWVLEPATSQSVTRTLARQVAPDADPNEVALGTLELLRASMMELHSPPPAAPTKPAPAAPVTESPRSAPTTPTFSLSGALAADLGLRSVGPSLTSVWAAWLKLGGCVGLRGFTALPLVAEATDVTEGHVEVEPTLLGLGLTCGLSRAGAALSPRVSLGFVGARVETRGTASEPRQSHSDVAWLGGGYGLIGLSLRLSHDLRLNLDATGVLLPQPAVIIANRREIGTWGAPGGVISLGLEVLSSR